MNTTVRTSKTLIHALFTLFAFFSVSHAFCASYRSRTRNILPLPLESAKQTTLATFRKGWIPAATVIDPEGKQVAYVCQSANNRVKVSLVLNGAASREYDDISSDIGVFSPDGQKFAYVAKVGENWHVYTRSSSLMTASPPCQAIKGLGFSPDGKRLAYCALRNNEVFISMNDKTFGPYDPYYASNGVVFAPKGGRFAFGICRKNGKPTIMTDAGEGEPYDNIFMPVFSPEGTSMAYIAYRENAYQLIIDEKAAINSCDLLSEPVFSPSGGRIACGALRDKKWSVRLFEKRQDGWQSHETGKKAPQYPVCLKHVGLVFSPDGRHLAYGAIRDDQKQVLVIDGVEQKPYAEVSRPVFSPDGRHCAYAARNANRGPWLMVVDGAESPEFDSITKTKCFSKDSHHFAFWAAAPNTTRSFSHKGLWTFYIDGKATKSFADFVCPPLFSMSDGAFIISGGNRGGREARLSEAEKRDYVPGMMSTYLTGGQHLLYVNSTAFEFKPDEVFSSNSYICRDWTPCARNRVYLLYVDKIRNALFRLEVDLNKTGVPCLGPNNGKFLPSKEGIQGRTSNGARGRRGRRSRR